MVDRIDVDLGGDTYDSPTGTFVYYTDYEALEAKLAALVTAAEDLVSLSVAAMWQGEWDIDGELKDIKGALAAAKGTP